MLWTSTTGLAALVVLGSAGIAHAYDCESWSSSNWSLDTSFNYENCLPTQRLVQHTCLPPKYQIANARFSKFLSWITGSSQQPNVRSRPVTIEVRNWASHKLVSHLAAILLKETVGLQVEVQEWHWRVVHKGGDQWWALKGLDYAKAAVNSTDATCPYSTPGASTGGGAVVWQRLARQSKGAPGVDLNFELWTAHWRLAEKVGLAEASTRGSLNYNGQSGLFVTVASLERLQQVLGSVVNTTSAHASKTSDVSVRESMRLGVDAFRGFFPLFRYAALQDMMFRAPELPSDATYFGRLSSCSYPDGAYGGTFDCANATWYPPRDFCCPRGSPSCEPGVPPCYVLCAEYPTYDEGVIEKAIIAGRLPWQIFWTGSNGAMAEGLASLSEVSLRPIPIYKYEPDTFITGRRFMRFDLQPDYYCDVCSDEYATPASTSLDLGPWEGMCGFPGNDLIKAAWSGLAMVEPDAWDFALKYNVDFEQMSFMSRLLENTTWLDEHGLADYRAAGSTSALNHKAHWQAACQLLLDDLDCNQDDSTCFKNWFRRDDMPSPSAADGDTLLFIFFAAMVASSIFLWIRGDGGYTTGYASPVSSLFSLFCFRKTLVRTDTAEGDEGMASRAASALLASRLPANGAESCSDPNAQRDSTISMGRSLLLVSDGDAYVALPLVRVGSSEREVTVRLASEENTEGNKCLYGVDFGDICMRPDAKYPSYRGWRRASTVRADGAEPEGLPKGSRRHSLSMSNRKDSMLRTGSRLVSVTFAPGARIIFVYVRLLARPRIAVEDPGCAEFTVRLVSASCATALGPVHRSVVRVVNVKQFPNGYHPGALEYGKVDQTAANLAQLNTLRKTNSDKAGEHVTAGSLLGGRFASAVLQSGLIKRMQLLVAFFRHCCRIDGIRMRLLKYQLSTMLLALLNNFITPVLYKFVLRYGVAQGRLDICILLALVKFVLDFNVRTYIELNYFDGEFLLMQHLRSLLCRKYLSLTEADHNASKELKEKFSVAVLTTCHEVRRQCWNGLFKNGVLPNLYKVLAAGLFLALDMLGVFTEGATTADVFTHIIVGVSSSSLFVCVICWYLYRANTGTFWWRVELVLSRRSEAQMHKVLYGWLPIRTNGSILFETAKTVGAFWTYIRRGNYKTWYYRFYTFWVYDGLRMVVLCVVLSCAPLFASSADFVPLLTVINSLGWSLQQFAEDVLDVLISSEQIFELAELLNQTSEERQVASRERLSSSAPRDATRANNAQQQLHGLPQFAAELDKEVQAWSANAEDARATSKLIAQTLALGEACKLHDNILAEMQELMGAWASLLDADDRDDGGALIIHEVRFALPQPIGHIFEGLSVRDLTDASADSTTQLAPIRLPSGRIIALRAASALCFAEGRDLSSEARTAELALINLLGGRATAQGGVACCVLRAALVTAGDAPTAMFTGSLWENLLYGDVTAKQWRHHATQQEPDEEAVWELCNRAGISQVLIGERFEPGWAAQQPSWLHIDDSDKVLVSLVRALLLRPDVLLLHRLADDWPMQRQYELVQLVRLFLEGSLDCLTHAHLEKEQERSCNSGFERRSALLCCTDPTLCVALEPDDLVLTLESRCLATLQHKKDALPDTKAVIHSWMHPYTPHTGNASVKRTHLPRLAPS